MTWRPGLQLAALSLLPLLGGCIAVAAIPVLAAGGLVARDQIRVRASTPRVALPPAAPSPTSGSAEPAITRGDPAGGLAANATGSSIAPQPGSLPDRIDDPQWERFVSYALGKAREAGSAKQRQSALLAPGTSLPSPQRRECQVPDPAVLIDLDSGAAPFDPTQTVDPAPGIARQLARLRDAGILVLWISQAPAAQVGELGRALHASGLDPTGHDPLLLIRNAADRKQALREDAQKDVCIVAIAGDRQSDFDEVFDYLRDPKSAEGMNAPLGSGWFIVPPPLAN